MAKSSTAQALASLQHKFQAKIREVGSLKRQLLEKETLPDSIAAKNRIIEHFETELRKAQLTIERLDLDLRSYERDAGSKVVLQAQLDDAQADLKRVQIQRDSARARLRDESGDVDSWKQFTVIGTILGLGVGVLATLAYIQQTGQL